jgi:MFS transporter, DHA1 family, tetracycline resistance protein
VKQKQLNYNRIIISFTAFLNFLGLTLSFPVFIPLMSEHGHMLPLEYSKELRGMLLGFFLGVYPLMQFFTAPILGVISDSLGRKRVLLIAATGNSMGNIIVAAGIFTHNIWIVLFGRIISGLFSGSLAVTQSAMADISTPATRSANFGLMGAMMGASLALGPAIGGILSDSVHGPLFTLATPFVAAALFAIVNVVMLVLSFSETLDKEHRHASRISVLTGPRKIFTAFKDPASRPIFIVVFLWGFGFNFFSQFFQYYLIERFQVTNTQFGILFGYIGFWAILSQGVFNSAVSKRFDPPQVLKVTILLLSLTFPLLLLIPSYKLLFAFVFSIPILNGLCIPNMTSIVSGLADQKDQGRIMGVSQAVQAVSMFLPPFIGGYLVGVNYTMPVWVTFVFIFFGWVIFVRGYKKSYRNPVSQK